MFVYRDLKGHDISLPGTARVSLAEPRRCDGPDAHVLVVITQDGSAGIGRHPTSVARSPAV